MACLQRESPALKEILLNCYRARRTMDHHLYEFGSVHYHIHVQQGPVSTEQNQRVYLSVSTPLLVRQGHQVMPPSSYALSDYTKQTVKRLCPGMLETVEPPNEGFQLTLQLNFNNMSQRKGVESIAKISMVRGVIVTSEVKEMLMSSGMLKIARGVAHRPIKLVYHPKESFYLVRQPKGIRVVFPMRFKENSDWTIAATMFQELTDVGSLKAYSKALQCSWSPVPPPELRGEPLEDLITNGGFVSFDVSLRHLKARKLDKTIWTLLNFHGYVNYHIKSTRGLIQRSMRSRLETLVEVLQNPARDALSVTDAPASGWAREQISSPEANKFQPECGGFVGKIKRLRFLINMRGFKWIRIRSFCWARGYVKLED